MLDQTKYTIPLESTARDALKRLNDLGEPSGVLFVLDKKERVVGTLTDGDVRRGLLKDFDVDDPLDKYMHKNFLYFNDKTYTIPIRSFYLLGILNSKVSEFVMGQLSPAVQRGYMEFREIYVGQLPIPNASPSERQAIERLVQRLLALRGEGAEVEALERELNERVYRVFGLTEDEIALIEKSLDRATSR